MLGHVHSGRGSENFYRGKLLSFEDFEDAARWRRNLAVAFSASVRKQPAFRSLDPNLAGQSTTTPVWPRMLLLLFDDL